MKDCSEIEIQGVKLTQYQVAMSYYHWKDKWVWSNFMRVVQSLDQSFQSTSKSFDSGIAIVNGKPCKFMKVDNYYLIEDKFEKLSLPKRIGLFLKNIF